MFFKRIDKKIDMINEILQNSNIIELSNIVGSKKEILRRNLIAGIARGVGIGIGVTVITAVISTGKSFKLIKTLEEPVPPPNITTFLFLSLSMFTSILIYS